jgi:hypothetical protein
MMMEIEWRVNDDDDVDVEDGRYGGGGGDGWRVLPAIDLGVLVKAFIDGRGLLLLLLLI